MTNDFHGPDADAEDLAQFGYKQELKRSLPFSSNFAIAFSFISATTGIFSLFGYGPQQAALHLSGAGRSSPVD